MLGALIFFATLIISFILGTPSVTFFDETPAKWKVLSVIYVAGSPMLCAAIDPTTSPALTKLDWNRDLISPSNQSNEAVFSLSCNISFLLANDCLKYIFASCVAFY